jgi:hypothetical protein
MIASGLITMRVWSIYGREPKIFNFLATTFALCQIATLVITIKAAILVIRKL